jgi:dephospho-CoA kinase
MTFLIAVTGFSGAGKTTAINYLSDIGVGQKIYLGQVVLDEIITRGLPPGPESERLVRSEFREQYGAGALAILASKTIEAHFARNANVLVDAVFEEAEYLFLQDLCSKCASPHLLAIEADFEIRSERLATRTLRPLTRQQLADRDAFEVKNLGTQLAMTKASSRIANEGTLQSFERELQVFWRAVTQSGVS